MFGTGCRLLYNSNISSIRIYGEPLRVGSFVIPRLIINILNNATKVFQALRIFVNQEISQLIHGLINAFKILPVGGVIAVVTFHSLEDKIVKFFFKNYSEIKNSSRYLPQKLSNLKLFNFSNKKTIFPTKKEIEINPASRSAKLRYALKINHTEDFSEFIKKFNYLIKIENLYKEL